MKGGRGFTRERLAQVERQTPEPEMLFWVQSPFAKHMRYSLTCLKVVPASKDNRKTVHVLALTSCLNPDMIALKA